MDVFSTRTDLPSRLKNFCGSIADSVTSESNLLHIRFYADFSANNSSFESLFTAYRERAAGKGGPVARGSQGQGGWHPDPRLDRDLSAGACDPETEYDCEDNTCIQKDLRCNGVYNCRFKWDEEDCKVSRPTLCPNSR